VSPSSTTTGREADSGARSNLTIERLSAVPDCNFCTGKAAYRIYNREFTTHPSKPDIFICEACLKILDITIGRLQR